MSFSKEKRFRDYLEEAEHFKSEKRYIESARAYRQLLRIDPKNLYYLSSIAKMYKQAKDYPMAISYYERLLHLYPNDVEALYELAQIFYIKKQDDKAESLLLRAHEIEPENYSIVLLLLRIAIRNHHDDKAKEYLGKAESIDKLAEPTWRAGAQYHMSKHNYQEAYKYLFNTNQLVSNEELEFLVWDLRTYVYPSAEVNSAYSQERERDLVSKLMTTQINTWAHQASLLIPFKDYFRITNTFNCGSQQQINLINGSNNYYVDLYSYLFELEVIKNPNLLMKLFSNQKWGENKPPVNFNFSDSLLWEPGVSIRYSDPHHLLSFSGYKDSYMGRHFGVDSRALFVRRILAEIYYEFRDPNSLSSIGVLGNAGTYKATKGNIRKLFSIWARYDVNPNPFHMVFEYKYEFSTFKRVSEDYSSYRAGYLNQGKVSLIRAWKNRGYLDCNYTFLWNKRRDLVNESLAITSRESRPEELKLNIYIAHIIECVGNKTLGKNFDLNLKFFYYMDSNDYRTAGGKLGLNCLF